MSVMLISIMFVNMTSAAQIKDIKGTRVERQYSNHYSAQFNELWDSFGRSEISIYDINYNINDTYNPTTFNDTNGRDSAGYEILLKVDGKEVWLGNSHYKNNEKYDSIYYGYSGIELDNIWFNDNYEDAAGNKFTQVNIVLKNTNQISKVFSLATTSDIEVGHDDNAFCRFIGNGFTMSNMYADNSDAQGGNIPSVALNVYTNGIAGVTDADCVYIGEWKKRKQNAWCNNVLGSFNVINNTRHGAMMGSSGCVDVGMSIAWKNRRINPGESITFSYILGVNMFDSQYEQLNEYYMQNGIDDMGEAVYKLIATDKEKVSYGKEYYIDVKKYIKDNYYYEKTDCAGRTIMTDNPSYIVVGKTVNKIYYRTDAYNKYKIMYDVNYNGGHWQDGANVSYTKYELVNNPIDLSLKAYKDGWDFNGWSTKNNSRKMIEKLFVEREDMHLYALFRKNISAGFIDANGRRNIDVSIYNNEKYCDIEAPGIREFKDWENVENIIPSGWTTCTNIDKAEGRIAKIAAHDNIQVYDDIFYYAVYEAKARVTFELNGGRACDSTKELLCTVYRNSFDLNKTRGEIITLPDCTRSPQMEKGGNYCFFELEGWRIGDKLFNPGDRIDISENTTISAVWKYADIEPAEMEIIKIASSFHGASMVKRTFGDDKWYKKSGKLEVKELKDYMPDECIQVWKINSSGDSLRIK